MKKLIQHVALYQDHRVLEGQNIAIDGSRITGFPEAPKASEYDEVIDGKGMLALPGFVNTHNHVAMTVFRSYADDMQLMDWLEKKIWPAEAKLTDDVIYAQSMLGIAEMIRCGTTAYADMYDHMDQEARAVEESGIRACLCRGSIGIGPNAQAGLDENRQLFLDWHGKADGRITVMMGPHAPYTCPPDYLHKFVDQARELGAEIHIHLSETKGEVENIKQQYGKSPIALMDEIGVLDCGCLAAHCVWVDDDDMNIMAEKHVRVAHNPGSNMKLASGIAPVPRLLREGVCVALGTDGASSNNNLDMLEEINLAAMLHKVSTLDPLAVPARTALKMGTEYGAKAVGLTGVGKLEAGCKADITLFDMAGAAWYPRNDLASQLVYSAHADSASTVLVDGRVLMEDGELLTLDKEHIFYEAQKCAERLTK